MTRTTYQLAEVVFRRASQARHTDSARKLRALADAARTIAGSFLWQGTQRATDRANELFSLADRCDLRAQR